ncbi:MAG: nuclease domain-containing protein [Acidobacteriaceae bacterium]
MAEGVDGREFGGCSVSNYRNASITRSAQGHVCTMRIPGICNHDSMTTIWAHSNKQRHGKGTGIKAHDIFGCYACAACHDWYDKGPASREEKDVAFQLAHEKSLLILVKSGILK